MEPFNRAGSAVSLSLAALATLLFCVHRHQRRQRGAPASAGNSSGRRTGAEEPEIKTVSEKIRPLWQVEKEAIVSALEKLNGDKLLAATKLGIGKTTLYRKLKKYGITVEPAISIRTTQEQESTMRSSKA